MDEVTQQNAALVEQAAAESLEEQAHTLVEAMAQFSIDSTVERSTAPCRQSVAGRAQPCGSTGSQRSYR